MSHDVILSAPGIAGQLITHHSSSLMTHHSSLLVRPANDLPHFIVTAKYQPLEGAIQFGYDYPVDAPNL
jgi:hypothetical protein